jgi:molybdopterin molybdotransferase
VTAWEEARRLVYEAGRSAVLTPISTPVDETDGLTLADDLLTLTDLPAFPTSSVDGYAVRGPQPWKVVGRVLAGNSPAPLADDGTAVEIATGGMLPPGAESVIRVEEITRDGDTITGEVRAVPEYRVPGEEAAKGELLIPRGTPVDAGIIGLAASCGYDLLRVHPKPRAALRVFGDELLTQGPPGAGRVRDALGPNVPVVLRRYGCAIAARDVDGPIADTLDAHVEAMRKALEHADLVCTTGGTMHGPVDHLHPALEALGAEYIVNTVAVRPGFPMLVARVPGAEGSRPRFVAGLPGNPQSALVALVSLVEPLLAGLRGRPAPQPSTVVLGDKVAGRRGDTHLALVRVDAEGTATPVAHVGSAMLRGLAQAHGFAVIAPHTEGAPGDRVPFAPLPLLPGERP